MASDESKPEVPSKGKGPSVLCLGVPRTGTKSLAEALRILGYNKVYHTSEIPITSPDWKFLNEAADATFPSLPNHSAKELTRADWDKIFGDYDAVTDIGAFYAKSLIKAYPEAKIILVQRDLRSWWSSWVSYIDVWAGPAKLRMTMAVEKVIKTENTRAVYKAHLGWMGGERLWDLHDKARLQYAAHYAIIREKVPAERVLDYQLSDGWGPLCGFLGKGVPEGKEFPKLNDGVAFREEQKKRQKERMRLLVSKLAHRPVQAGEWKGRKVHKARKDGPTNGATDEKKQRPRTSMFLERFESVKKKVNDKRVSFAQERKEKEKAKAKAEAKRDERATNGGDVLSEDAEKQEPKTTGGDGGGPSDALKKLEGAHESEKPTADKAKGDEKTENAVKEEDASEQPETFHQAPEPGDVAAYDAETKPEDSKTGDGTGEGPSKKGKEPAKDVEPERFPEMA